MPAPYPMELLPSSCSRKKEGALQHCSTAALLEFFGVAIICSPFHITSSIISKSRELLTFHCGRVTSFSLLITFNLVMVGEDFLTSTSASKQPSKDGFSRIESDRTGISTGKPHMST